MVKKGNEHNRHEWLYLKARLVICREAMDCSSETAIASGAELRLRIRDITGGCDRDDAGTVRSGLRVGASLPASGG